MPPPPLSCPILRPAMHPAVFVAPLIPIYLSLVVLKLAVIVNHSRHRGVWPLYGEQAGMQELVLSHPGSSPSTADRTHQLESADALREAFESHLAECGPLAFRVARAVLRNTADAEDVAQEALLRAFRRFHRLRERERFRAWLVRIAFRLALDRARSAKRRELRETEWSRPERRAPAPNAEDLAARTQFAERLDRALDELPEKLRLVLLLAAMQGHTLEEVASMLAVPVGTVKSRLFLARKQLTEKLRCYAKNIDQR